MTNKEKLNRIEVLDKACEDIYPRWCSARRKFHELNVEYSAMLNEKYNLQRSLMKVKVLAPKTEGNKGLRRKPASMTFEEVEQALRGMSPDLKKQMLEMLRK